MNVQFWVWVFPCKFRLDFMFSFFLFLLLCLVFVRTSLAQAPSFFVSFHRRKFKLILTLVIGPSVKLRIVAPNSHLPLELSLSVLSAAGSSTLSGLKSWEHYAIFGNLVNANWTVMNYMTLIKWFSDKTNIKFSIGSLVTKPITFVNESSQHNNITRWINLFQ